MSEYDLLSLVFITGISIPVALYIVYWFAVETAKKYVDKEVRKVK